MTANEMWDKYTNENNLKGKKDNIEFYAWSFGDTPDELAQLCLKGIKTSSSSAYQLYEKENQKLSEAGDYHIVLDSNDEAICIIRTTSVRIIPFNKITEKEAMDEGDGSLDNWLKIHRRYFREELDKYDIEFNEEIPLVYEEFELVYPIA